MPRYDYTCSCGKKRDKFLSYKDYRKPVYCECGKQMKKLVPHFQWKFASVASRTDVELEVKSMDDSMNEMANG